jgi:hypothetical protein
MINQKNAGKLRKLLGVKSRADRTYTTQDGAHHTLPFAAKHHVSIGARAFTRETKKGIPIFQMTVTLSKESPRSVYQRIKRRGIAARILAAGVAP